MNATIENLIFVDPQQDMKVTMKLGIGFGITIGVYGLLLILVIYSSYKDWNTEKSKQQSLNQVVQCWSTVKNCDSLFYSMNPVDNNLDAFNGVRFLMMCWIIMGHIFSNTLAGPVPNIQDTPNVIKNEFGMTFLTSANYSVDVFFTISGFLCGLSMTKTFAKKSNRNAKIIVLAIVGRFLRLIPLVGLAMLTYLYILPVLFSGPINNFWSDIRKECVHFYSTLFFFNNFEKSSSTRCMK